MVIRLLAREFFLKSLITLWYQFLHLCVDKRDQQYINICKLNCGGRAEVQEAIHNLTLSHLLSML